MRFPSLRDPDVLQQALAHLHRVDPLLSVAMHKTGPMVLKLERNKFKSLVRSIIAQQISTKAARSITAKLLALLPTHQVTPEALAELTPEQFRSAGVSPQKIGYLTDLASKVTNGDVRLSRISRLSDEEVIAELIQVKGIGVWTAQMFLIFSLGRTDVFPHADLGIRMGLKRLHQLDDLPVHPAIQLLAEPWRPYASVASWYLWRSGDQP